MSTDDITKSSWKYDVTTQPLENEVVEWTATGPVGVVGSRPSMAGGNYVFNNPASVHTRTVITAAYFITFIVGFVGNLLVIYVLAALGIARVGKKGGTASRCGGHSCAASAGCGIAGGDGVGVTLSVAATSGTEPFRMFVVRMKSVANCYIANLVVADLLFVCTLPLFCWLTMVSDWPFGSVACKAAYAIRENNKFVGIYVLVALSVDRYLASHYDLGRWRTLVVGRAVCIVIWIASAMMTTPYWMHARVIVSGTKNSCRMIWPSVTSVVGSSTPLLNSSTSSPKPVFSSVSAAVTWTRFQFAADFAVPFAAIIAAYAALGVRLRRLLAARSATRGGGIPRADGACGTTVTIVVENDAIALSQSGATKNGSSSASKKTKTKKSAVKRPSRAMTRMTIVVTVTFIVTQLPYHVIEMMKASKAEQLHAVARQYSNVTSGDGSRRKHPETSPAAIDPTHDCKWTSNSPSSLYDDEVERGGIMTSSTVAFASVTGDVVTLRPATDLEMSVMIWLNAIANMLQFVSTCLNPVIYGLMNRNYRALYSEVMFRHCPNCWLACCGCCSCCSNLEVTRRQRRRPPTSTTGGGGSRRRRSDASRTSGRRRVTGAVGSPGGSTSGPAAINEGAVDLLRRSGGGRESYRDRRHLDVDYCRDGWVTTPGNNRGRRGFFVSRDSVSSSPGLGQSSAFPITTVSCLEMMKVDQSIPVVAVHQSIDEIQL